MPGRLMMEQQGAMLSQDPKRDRSQAQAGNPPQTQDFAVQHAPPTNGVLANGISSPVPSAAIANGGSNGSVAGQSQAPPALDQSWRESHANKSLGLMLGRLAQQCHTDLNEVINKMSELPAPTQASQANGISQPGVDVSEHSLTRKRLFMEFAQNQRDRFIKSLVLTDWARNAGDDMAKLIDIRVWEDQQRNASANAISRIGAIKHSLQSAKMPAPNIEGAMELLATGKAPSSIPDLGYLPPKPLTAKQLLRTLSDMNVILSERLIVHEDPPHHFNNYDIANGRATFRVAKEFEVDLSVADEDPTSPFYFIDFRFAFSPAPKSLNEQFRAHLEERCNQALAKSGLSGCYDFLHNFVLTQKITFLRDQANELNRHGRWFRSLRVDQLRRVLCVQYWATQSGPKNWLQFSIVSGKQNAVRTRKPATPQLRVLWFRQGVEVKDDTIDVDWQTVDLEQILETTVARHITYVMKNIRDRLQTLAGENSKLKTAIQTSTSTPEDCYLSCDLQPMSVPLKAAFEPVTGRIAFSPPTFLTTNVETRLYQDAALDKAIVLANMLCNEALERVRVFAELRDWQTTTGLVRQDNLAILFGKDVLCRSIYTCQKGWGPDWALVVTFSLSGEKWWVVRLRQVQKGRIIDTVQPIRLPHVLSSSQISLDYLRLVEKSADAEVFYTALSKQLTATNTSHSFVRLTPLSTAADSNFKAFDEPSSSVAMFLKTPMLQPSSSSRRRLPWANDSIRITFKPTEIDVPVEGELLRTRYDARFNVVPDRLENLREYLASGPRSDMIMNDSGALVIRVQTQFGKPSVEQLWTRIGNIQRLDGYLSELKRLKWRCTSASLLSIAFIYCENPLLSAEISFPKGDGKIPMRLRLEPQGSNPHQRIRAIMEQQLITDGEGAFRTLTTTMGLTLPLLLAFERIEAKDVGRGVVFVHARQPLWFNLTYKAPLPPCAFDIRIRKRVLNGQVILLWYISRSQRPGAAELPQSIAKALQELYMQPNENGWWGVGNAVVAHESAVVAVIERVDETIRKFEGIDIKPPADELDSKPLIQQTSVKTAPAPAAVQPVQPVEPQQQQQQPPQRPAPPPQQAPQAQMMQQQRQRQQMTPQQFANQQQRHQMMLQQQQQQALQRQRAGQPNPHPANFQNRGNGPVQNVRNDVIEID